MKKSSKYRLYVRLMILSGIVLAITLSMTSLKIIRGGKGFTQVILAENKTFLVNALRFGHGVMSHGGSGNYESLIDLALKSKFVRYLAVLDKDGNVVAQSDLPNGLVSILKEHDLSRLEDGKILEDTKDILLVAYYVEEIVAEEEHVQHHATLMAHKRVPPKPTWFLVDLNTSAFKHHYHDMVVQTVGTGAAFLLLGILVIVFLGVIQRYELAHLAIEKLHKIKRLLGHFVPETAKNVIEKDPERKGLLDKYIQDTTVLFLDIEGFTILVDRHAPETLNRTIESYFSTFLDLIQKNGGDINETAGDGMMVIFQDPDPVQHAKNASQTALQIWEKCMKMPENGDPDLFPIQVNIGIQSGEVYLGSTKMRGNEAERWTFTASGAVTIMAARLAHYAREGQILVGEETAGRIRDFYSLNALGNVPLKNVQDSGKVYEISPPKIT
jgi:class 3 adenylate cyclase